MAELFSRELIHSMSCEELFLKALRARGLRLTPQRQLILSVMHEMEAFATVEEIHARVQRPSAAIDVSTVYRTLDLLLQFDMVTCIDGPDGQRRYRLTAAEAPHLHLVCSGCGEVLCVESEHVQHLLEQLSQEYGFRVTLERASLPGLCRRCAAERRAAGG